MTLPSPTIRVWDSSTCRLVHVLSGHADAVNSVVFSPDGGLILSGGLDGIIKTWDVRNGVCLKTPFYGQGDSNQAESDTEPSPPQLLHEQLSHRGTQAVNLLSFSPDGTRVIAGFDSSIRVLDAQTGEVVSTISTAENEVARWVGYSSDGTEIIAALATRNPGLQIFMKQSPQKSPKSPNIVRVWQAAGESDWSVQSDGRILTKDGFFIWAPLDPWQQRLVSNSKSVLFIDDSIKLEHSDLCIGERWSECYIDVD